MVWTKDEHQTCFQHHLYHYKLFDQFQTQQKSNTIASRLVVQLELKLNTIIGLNHPPAPPTTINFLTSSRHSRRLKLGIQLNKTKPKNTIFQIMLFSPPLPIICLTIHDLNLLAISCFYPVRNFLIVFSTKCFAVKFETLITKFNKIDKLKMN